MAIRYIGAKTRVADAIMELVGTPSPGARFIDGFCGTGAVAAEAAKRGWPIRLNDTLVCATTLAAARLASAATTPFLSLGGYQSAIQLLNDAPPAEGFVWREYSPESVRFSGLERKYFTPPNAARIDGMRKQIRRWSKAGSLLPAEEGLLVADLLEAASSVASIAGTYGCYLKNFTPGALRAMTVKPREQFDNDVDVDVSNVDVLDVVVGPDDVAYYDPPYTKRQYAAYYHLLETIALGDEPVVEGITGLRPWQHKASAYCYKKRAHGALVQLLETTRARRVVLSYSSEGHVDLDELMIELEPLGHVSLHLLGEVGRYRPNQTASDSASVVNEYLVELTKPEALEAVA